MDDGEDVQKDLKKLDDWAIRWQTKFSEDKHTIMHWGK